MDGVSTKLDFLSDIGIDHGGAVTKDMGTQDESTLFGLSHGHAKLGRKKWIHRIFS